MKRHVLPTIPADHKQILPVVKTKPLADIAPTNPRTATPVDEAENCPVIRADKVFLGFSFQRHLRVVCFENPSAVA